MKPCPVCGPLHDLDAVTCTRCGHTEALPERSPAVRAAMAALRGERLIGNSPTRRDDAIDDILTALEAEGT